MTMNNSSQDKRPVQSRRQQSGAALVIGLLLLVVLTILAISGLSTSTLELQMAGNEQYQERAFQSAEAGIEQAISSATFTTDPTATSLAYDLTDPINPKPKRGLGTPTTDCPVEADEPEGQCEHFIRFDQTAGTTPVPVGGYSLGTGFQAYHFVIESYGVAERGAQSEHTQSLYIVGPGN